MAIERPRDLFWSRERWFMTVTIVFAAQIIIVIWLGARDGVPVKSESTRFRTYQYTADVSDAIKPLLDLMDPTMYSKAHVKGFSGDVWLKKQPIEHRSPGWTDKPQFLKFDEEQLLGDLEAYGETDPPQRRVVVAPAISGARARAALSDALKPVPKSLMEITGDVSEADLRSQPQLPVIEYDGVLEATRVGIMVDRRGRVFSANLAGRSGSPTADSHALRIVRSLQFEMAEGISPGTDNRDFSSFRRATVTVRWWTVPVPDAAASETELKSDPPKVESLP